MNLQDTAWKQSCYRRDIFIQVIWKTNKLQLFSCCWHELKQEGWLKLWTCFCWKSFCHIPLDLTVHYQFALQPRHSCTSLQSSCGSSVTPRTSDTKWLCPYAHIMLFSCSGWHKAFFPHAMSCFTSQQIPSSPVSITGHISNPLSGLYNHESNNLRSNFWWSGFRGNQCLNILRAEP